MLRWSWRLFKREWRQQFLILLLIIVAVAAVVVGSAVAVNTPPPANAGFGTAHDLATFNLTPTSKSASTSLPTVEAQIAEIEHAVGTVQVIANETFTVPGSTQTYQLRSQDPHGPYGGPMLQLLSGRYPTGPDQIALTPGLASELNLQRGRHVAPGRQDRRRHRAEPPEPARRVRARPAGAGDTPDAGERPLRRVAHRVKSLSSLSSYITTPGSNTDNIINPATIVLALATVGMLLIALVSIGGFTVLAQRRMRSLGMLESMGATDRNVRLVLEANGVIVGVVGAVVGFALGLVLWLAYRPTNEQNAHHLIAMFALPWKVIAPAMVLAVIATFFAASYPARAITRVPVVSALAGRPAPPRQIHRSLVPGVIALVIGFIMFSVSGASGNGGGVMWLVPGLVALIVGIILVSPFFLALLARIGGRSPIAIRLPLRDMARYRARSGSALSAISLGIMIAVIICAVAVARYANVFDYVGPEHGSERAQRVQPAQRPDLRAERSSAEHDAAAEHPDAGGRRARHRLRRRREAPRRARQSGGRLAEPERGRPPMERRDLRGDAGPPAGLRHQPVVHPVRRRHPQLAARTGGLRRAAHLRRRREGRQRLPGPGAGGNNTNSCTPGSCLAHPVVQEESQLPTGTSAPNTVITESALHRLHLADQNSLDGWMILTNSPITSAQLTSANSLAASADLSTESKNDEPTSAEIVNWATVFGIALALGVLAMSVGLIRSETASELRTLTATGASSRTRRSLTAVTAGGLAFLGALLGTVAAYVGLFGWFRSNQLEGGVSDIINHVPWDNLFFILIAMPVAAMLIGWLLAGRDPTGIATRPME